MPLNALQILGLLRGPTTEQVLQNHVVTIAGYPNGSEVRDYACERIERNGRDSLRVTFDPGVIGPDPQMVQAHSVCMVSSANMGPLNQIAGYLLDHTGPDLMFTGMLNGCSFVMKATPDRSRVRCAHLRPPPGEAGSALHTACVNTGAFAGDAGAVTVFGRNSYLPPPGLARSATVLGVRRAGAWEIYAQIFDSFFNITGAARIL